MKLRFFKNQKIWPETVFLSFFIQTFETIGVNLTLESIYMEEEFGLEKYAVPICQ